MQAGSPAVTLLSETAAVEVVHANACRGNTSCRGIPKPSSQVPPGFVLRARAPNLTRLMRGPGAEFSG